MKGFIRFLVATCLAGTALAQTKLKIMPLGDSITEITCWRTTVWDNLVTAGLDSKVQFVGTMTDNTQNCVGKNGATWDHHHEGHSGYLAINIANSNMTVWLQSNVPDIVMFMLGTNDIIQQSKATADITAAYTKIITEIRAKNPAVKIIIDTVIPCTISNSQITSLNAAIPAWAASQNTTASPIWIANTATGFPTSDLRDGVHPNSAGDAIIAAALTPVLEMVINKSLTATKAIEFKA